MNHFTDRTQGFLQEAHQSAVRKEHPHVLPIHVLGALLSDPQGGVSALMTEAGGTPTDAMAQVALMLEKQPVAKNSQVTTSPALQKVLIQAKDFATSLGTNLSQWKVYFGGCCRMPPQETF